MNAVRRYVFPVIWMLILGVIALALAKLAFFPATTAVAGEDTLQPVAEFDQYALVAAAPGDIASTLELPATVQPDAGTALKATTAGEITKVWARNGDVVQEGTRVLQVRVPQEPEPIAPLPVEQLDPGSPEAGAPIAAPVAPAAPAEQEYTYVNLVATAPGTVKDLTVVAWQSLAVGDTVATLSPGTYSIVADLSPEQQLSLLDREIVAAAQVPGAADPVPCAAPSISEDEEVEEPGAPQIDPMTGQEIPATTSSAQLRCPVPAGTRVVPGLAVNVSVDLGSATGVLTVPMTAVEGMEGTGTVYVLDATTGEPSPVEVGLGLRGDGIVEITSGLEEGQEILQFVPGVDDPDAGMGGEVW